MFYIESKKSIIFSDVTINEQKINTTFELEKGSQADNIYQIIRFQDKILFKAGNKIFVVNYLNHEFDFLDSFPVNDANVFIFSHYRNSIISGTKNNEIEILEIDTSIKQLFEIKTLPIKIIEKFGEIIVYCKKGFIYSINNENIINEKRVIFNETNEPIIINKTIG